MNKLILLFLVLFTGAYSFNHPEIQWKTVETSHVTINYYDKTEAAVYAAWKIAEEVYVPLAELYNYKPAQKMSLSLAEYEDFSNGFAEWLTGSIMIWTIDSRFDMRSNTTWLRNVITHEMAHIMSLEQKRNTLIAAVGANVSIETPNESYLVEEMFSQISEYPEWLAEGVAQFETEQYRHDAFDSRRQMMLRCAVLAGKELSFDEMGYFTHDLPGNELVYNQGYSFTKYIAGQIGKDRLRSLLRDASGKRTLFSESFTAATGLSLRNLYATWKDSLRTTFRQKAVSSAAQVQQIMPNGFLNLLPRTSPDGTFVACFSSGIDASGRTDLLLIARNTGKVVRRVPYAHTALCFSSNSRELYFVKSREPDRNGSYLNDLFSLDIRSGKVRRITRSGRVYDVAVVPNSGKLLCIRFEDNAFGIYTCNTADGSFTRVVPGELGMPFVNISVNPERENEAVVSRVINGQSRLYRMRLDRDSLAACSPGGAQEESPCWGKNGRMYYSADYDGVFNIYSVKPDGSDLRLHTRTNGGYFSPDVSVNGKMLASHYTASGFSIVETDMLDESYEVALIDRPRFDNVPVAEGTVSIKSKPYVPVYRRSLWEGTVIGQYQTTDNIIYNKVSDYDTSVLIIGGSISRYKTDALHKRSKALGFAAGVQKYSFEASPAYDDDFYMQPGFNAAIQEYRGIFSGMRNKERLTGKNVVRPVSSSGIQESKRFRTSQSSGDESGESSGQLPLIAFSQPYFAFESSEMAATIGISGTATLINLILPSEIAFTPYLSWHIAREWQLDIVPDLVTRPFAGLSHVNFPVAVSWNHAGYINEDFQLNWGGASQVSGGITMESFSALSLLETTGDTLSVTAKGYTAFLSFFHALPLFRYAALQVQSFSSFRQYGQEILDEMLFVRNDAYSGALSGNSKEYVYTQNSVNLVVPVWRNINNGTRNYISNLYGNVRYSVQALMNSTFLEERGPIDTWITGAPDNLEGALSIEHFLSFGLELGRYKSNMFEGALQLDLSLQLLHPGSRLTFTSGF